MICGGQSGFGCALHFSVFLALIGGGRGPGGWWIIAEPELHLGDNVLVPDLAGWRRTRLPVYPRSHAVSVAPDWVCEILSPSTRRMDLQWKRTAYPAVAAIQHYVVIAQSSIDISVFDRAGGFAKRRITAREGVLDLPACGLTIPVAEIYRHTGLV